MAMTAGAFEPQLPDHVWLEVREFVLGVVAQCAGKTPYDDHDIRIAVTKLVVWARFSAGLPLDREVLFRRDVIANFVAVGALEYRPAGRGNLRSQLLRISEVIAPAHAVRPLNPLPPSDPTHPYTSREVIALRAWAAHQSTPARIANAGVLLALGLGAGLAASEIGNVTVADLLVDNDGVVVHTTGERARDVPVLTYWAGTLRVRSGTLAADRFIFRENHQAFYPNLVSNFVKRSTVLGPQPQTQRMRTTWIVHHLTQGTPVRALARAAGIDSLEAFTRYLRFVPDIDDDEYRRLLHLSNIDESPNAR